MSREDGNCFSALYLKQNVELWRWRVSDIASSDWLGLSFFRDVRAQFEQGVANAHFDVSCK
jgi:hypothetical protein